MTTLTFDEPLLTHDDERALARAIEAGVIAGALLESPDEPCPPSAGDLALLEAEGRAAYRRLVRANLRLVAGESRGRARLTGVDADELFQEGVLGLLEAARRFDHERGCRFATFALPWIRMRIAEASASRLGQVGLSGTRARRWRQAEALSRRLTEELGRDATVAEVAAAWGRPASSVGALLAWQPTVPLDVHALGHPAAPTVGGDEIGQARWTRALRRLTADQRAVVERRFGLDGREPASYVAVARALGVSVATVRRREQSALAVLRGCAELSCAS